MSQDVTQWLAEIKTLQQQLATACEDRDQAYASSANWRKLYETEAQQRRTDAHLAQQTIESLKAEIAQLRGGPNIGIHHPQADPTVLQSQIETLATPEALKIRLLEVIQEREQLAQALKLEQANHAQTRKSLTTALGDAVDRLTKERATPLSPLDQANEVSDA